jgi:hypothetical protein
MDDHPLARNDVIPIMSRIVATCPVAPTTRTDFGDVVGDTAAADQDSDTDGVDERRRREVVSKWPASGSTWRVRCGVQIGAGCHDGVWLQ